MDLLLDCDAAVAEKDRLYRALDRMVEHKAALEPHLAGKWRERRETVGKVERGLRVLVAVRQPGRGLQEVPGVFAGETLVAALTVFEPR
jgi:hypothetical protein